MSQIPEIFISYAWGEEREIIVNTLYETFKTKGYNIIRDKINLSYKGSITDFMNRIGNGKIIIVIISDKYLKSENCMYEIVQIQKQGQFHDRIFPIVLSDADFYKPINRIVYIKFWEDEISKLNQAMKGINDMSVISDIQRELSNYREILNSISNIMFILKDMNTLTPDIHRDSNFETLILEVEKRLLKDSKESNTVNVGKVENRVTNVQILDPLKEKRKQDILKRLEMLNKMLSQYEDKLMLVDDPKTMMRFEKEIETTKENISKAETELNNLYS